MQQPKKGLQRVLLKLNEAIKEAKDAQNVNTATITVRTHAGIR